MERYLPWKIRDVTWEHPLFQHCLRTHGWHTYPREPGILLSCVPATTFLERSFLARVSHPSVTSDYSLGWMVSLTRAAFVCVFNHYRCTIIYNMYFYSHSLFFLFLSLNLDSQVLEKVFLIFSFYHLVLAFVSLYKNFIVFMFDNFNRSKFHFRPVA